MSNQDQQRDKEALECDKLALEIRNLRGKWQTVTLMPTLATALASALIAAIAVWAAFQSAPLLDIAEAKLELEKLQLRRDVGDLRTAQKTWVDVSLGVINEVSGLSACGLATDGESNLAVAVDDEMEEIFVLSAFGQLGIGIRGVVIHGAGIDDLEAICYDARQDQDRYYAIASHRRHDEPDETKMLGFRIESARVGQPNYRLNPNDMKEWNLTSGLISAMKQLDIAVDNSDENRIRVNGRAWWRRDENAQHPYALEIEAAVCVEGNLVVGLKYPLDKNEDAILLTFDLDNLSAPPVARPIDLDGFGISALAFDKTSNYLLVAANPTLRPRPGYPEDKMKAYFQSALCVFDYSTFKMIGRYPARREGAKLEGLAVIGRELWLAYEGDQTRLERADLAEIYRELRNSLGDRTNDSGGGV